MYTLNWLLDGYHAARRMGQTRLFSITLAVINFWG